jgi:hypothetical protein
VIKVYPTTGSIKARDTAMGRQQLLMPDNVADKQRGASTGGPSKLHDDGKTYLLIGVNNDMSVRRTFASAQ